MITGRLVKFLRSVNSNLWNFTGACKLFGSTRTWLMSLISSAFLDLNSEEKQNRFQLSSSKSANKFVFGLFVIVWWSVAVQWWKFSRVSQLQVHCITLWNSPRLNPKQEQCFSSDINYSPANNVHEERCEENTELKYFTVFQESATETGYIWFCIQVWVLQINELKCWFERFLSSGG